jgi:hypothetical protein
LPAAAVAAAAAAAAVAAVFRAAKVNWTHALYQEKLRAGKLFQEAVKAKTGKPPAIGTVRAWLDANGIAIPSEMNLTMPEAVQLSQGTLPGGIKVRLQLLRVKCTAGMYEQAGSGVV